MYKEIIKGRLNGMFSYEIGPMDAISIEDATMWRNDITQFCSQLGVHTLNPCDKPLDDFPSYIEDKQFRRTMKEVGNYDKLAALIKKYIRQPDLRFTDKADFLIAHVDIDVKMCGTWEEIFISNRSKKPILIKMSPSKVDTPDWLLATIPPSLIFNTWDELKAYLLYIHDFDNIVDDLGRWVFINYEKVYKKGEV